MRWYDVNAVLVGLLASPAVHAQHGTNSSTDFEASCDSLASRLQLENSTVWVSQYVPANTSISIQDANATCSSSQVAYVDLCRVTLKVETSERSEISMEAWLPKNWTGRFLSTGNGGLGGCIQYEDVAYAASLGFASVGANNGHNGTSGGAFNNNDEVLADFAYRSIHTGVVIGKQITSTFYGQPHTKSYYLGCSTGGRQGFKSVQDFPEDFDGVVAGAPALAFNGLLAQSGWFYLKTGPPNSSTFVTQAQWAAVHQDVLAQCDTLDGAADGILEDPSRCDYRPERLLCGKSSNSTTCLTGEQAATVRRVFEPIYGANNTYVFPGATLGGETLGSFLLYSGRPFQYSLDWFQYVVYNDLSWTFGPNYATDVDRMIALNPFNIQTWEGDISAFRDNGGKLIHYHGEMDGLIPSANSPRYYEHVSRTMNLRASELDDFYRFFRVSGMSHCSGGDGAFAIGNQLPNGVASTEPDQNVLMATVRWVEEGIAPETITGTKWVNGTKASGVDYTRRHCKYPATNQFQGGDFKDPDAWKCV